ncbi:MAG: hypothetical protein KKE62_18445 [Proteobacteria bacterium]|nr:hypothetical protein [Pseudomonadota bacterium]MBU1388521.1 hypothetical protein [Pseudomonadota bacterium]MBU1544818.1 hypothetical protein [Pseudomonadota bacterium]MBU2431732.1 hypothetical protein [Pseudomonadota bacterium]MBU2481071.1 hypothetical protein [Pseudomonadota bacterium]
MDQSRRSFFRKYCLENTVKLISDVHTSFKEAKSDTDYFESYETCYPLISEYSYFIDDEVEDLEIETDGKSKLDIVKMVYGKKGRID